DVAIDRRVPAFRVESYGGTQLAIDIASDAGGYAVVEGPLDGNGDAVRVGAGSIVGEGRHIDVTLDKAGVYRILAGTSESLGKGGTARGSVHLAVSCSAS